MQFDINVLQQIALSDFCLPIINQTGINDEAVNALSQYLLTDDSFCDTAMRQIIRSVMHNYEDVQDVFTHLRPIMEKLNLNVLFNLDGVIAALNFMWVEWKQSEDLEAIKAAYMDAIAYEFSGRWVGISTEISRIMLNHLISHRLLQTDIEFSSFVTNTLKSFKTDGSGEIYNCGFIWEIRDTKM